MIIRTISGLLSMLVLCSCASHYSGLITSSSPQVGDARYVDVAVGYSRASYFLSIGGFGQNALVGQAKMNLYRNADLQQNHVLENMSLDIVRSYFGPYMKTEAVVLADIVEREEVSISYQDSPYYSNQNLKRSNQTLLKPGERVVFNLKERIFIEGRVIEFWDNGGVKLFFIHNGKVRIKNVKNTKIFKISEEDLLKEKFGFKPGEKVKGQVIVFSGTKSVLDDLEIIGLNSENALLKSEKRGFYSAKLKDIEIIEGK